MRFSLAPSRRPAVLLAIALLASLTALQAQDRPPQGNFDLAQMRERMQERLRTQFEVTDDSEWKLISERIAKVMEARRNVGGGGPGGFGGGPGGAGGPPPQGMNRNSSGPRQSGSDQRPPEGSMGPGFNRESNPELDALRKAIDAKASKEEIKTKLEQLRAARKAKEAELEKAQADLRQLLTARQEAIAVVNGLLK